VIDALRACREDAKLQRLGGILAAACCEVLQSVPAEHRASLESELVAWALTQPDDAWRVDVDNGTIEVGRLRLRLDDLTLDTIVAALGRLLTALHAGLVCAGRDMPSRLEQMRWCIEAARSLPPNHHRMPPALRLIASNLVPRFPQESDRVLREPATSFADLDRNLLEQFGLPAWPSLCGSTSENGVVISNEGIGAALGLSVRPSGALFEGEVGGTRDVAAGEEVAVALPGQHREAEIRFRKFGAEHLLTLRLDDLGSASTSSLRTTSPTVPISRKRLEAQRAHRKQIDHSGLVIGSSPEILRVFEEIHYANRLPDPAAVLILGEPGVGKTHIARLIHGSSKRASAEFRDVNAGGAGGDLNIQRGEWVGYGRGHGISGVEAKGRPGHLMRASGGTLFVDEFAVMSQDLQVILLSVLEQRPVERIGGDSFTPDVRCIFATNADIDAAASDGSLRQDLLDRIGITIRIPPLRDRRGDILLLARHFTGAVGIEDSCLVALLRHDWPGNIRELQKTLGRAVVRAQSEGAGKLSVEYCELPRPIVEEAEGLADENCRRELWLTADSIARAEGYEPGGGLQRRAAGIMCVTESQASKMYRAFGLSEVPGT
jgi:transcriptional regulator with AAA-type ATPase domain